MDTQLIVDNVGNIVFLQAGFLGAQNDAANFLLMERIGPVTNHDMSPAAVLLTDKGYADTIPLLTPFRTGQNNAYILWRFLIKGELERSTEVY